MKCHNILCKHSLRKHAYSNILKIVPSKNENIQIKNSDIFHIFAQNIDCGYSLEPRHRGGSNEYPQSMFTSRNKKDNVYPCKPQFYFIKVGFKGVKLYRYIFVMRAHCMAIWSQNTRKTTNTTTLIPITDIASQAPTIWNRLRREPSFSLRTSHRRAIKEGSKVINHD